MKNFKYLLFSLFTILVLTISCEESDSTFGEVIAPTNLNISYEIVGIDAANPDGDGSGQVVFIATADNALSYNFVYGDTRDEVVPSGHANHRYSVVGLNTYTVVVSAIGTGGLTTTASITIDVFSSFDDQEAKDFLSGGSGFSKTWYWAAAELGHLGVGPSRDGIDGDWWWPKWYEAQPFEKAGDPDSSCIYEDELIFSLDTNNQLTYELNNNGRTFYNGGHSGLGGDDICLDLDTSGIKSVALSPSSSGVPEAETRGTVMNFSDAGFMGYYLGASSYEILSVTNSTLYVRVIDSGNADLAWYHKFSTSPPTQDSFETIYTNLVWADEFDTNGAPNSVNWTYDLGAGGWGNNEVQTYTSDAENVVVEDGSLKIITKKEGSDYTSARLKTQGLYDFTYGRIEVKAKLPSGGGTWSAIWMLGSSISTVGWPACGEIDIMEHVGNNEGVVQAAIHTTSSSGGTVNLGNTNTATATSEFHLYTAEWTPDKITFLVDDEVFYTYEPATQDADTWPFTAGQFIVLNVAMGGNLGGDIDSSFTESIMEVDYVRVFQ